MKRFLKRAGIFLVAACLLLAGAFAAATAYLNSAAFRRVMIARVDDAIAGRVELAHHHLAPLSGRLTLGGIRLVDAAGETAASIRQIELTLFWPALAWRTIDISRLLIDTPSVSLTYDQEDRLNLVQALAVAGEPTTRATGDAGAFQLNVGDFQLTGGGITFDRPATSWSGEAQRIDITGGGNLRQQSGRLVVAIGQLRIQAPGGGDTLHDVTLAADYDARAADPVAIVVTTPQSRIALRGRVDWSDDGLDMALVSDLAIDLAEARAWLPAAIDLSGRVKGRITADGALQNPSVTAGLEWTDGGVWDLEVRRLTLDARLAGSGLPGPGARGNAQVDLLVDGVKVTDTAPLTRGELSVVAQWADGVLEITRGKIGVGDHRIAADGRLDWHSEHLEASGNVHSPSMDELGGILGIALPAGSASLEFRCQGPWRRPAGHAVLLARDLAWEQWTFGQLLVEAELGPDGIVHFPRLVLENQGSYLEGRGRLDLLHADGSLRADLPLAAELDLDPLDLAHFTAAGPFDARLQGQLQVSGSAADPTADLTLAPSSVRWQARSGMLQGAFHWQAGGLTVSDLRLSTERSAVRVQGNAQLLDADSGQWTADPRVQARVTGESIDLADFLDGYGGTLALQADVEGPVSQLQGRFRLDGRSLDLGVQTVDAIHLAGRLTPGKVFIDPLVVTVAPGEQVRATGWYGFDQSLEAALTMDGVDLRHIDALAEGPAVSGRIDLELNAHGTLAHPHVAGRLGIRAPRLGDLQWDEFTARIQLEGRRLEVEADLNFKLTANARLDNGDFDVTALFDRTDLAPYLALLVDGQWAGRLSGRAQASGNWHALADVGADVALSDARLSFKGVDLLRFDTLEARLTDGVLHLPATRMELLQEGHLTVAAAGHLQREMTMQADGQLPLAVVDPFTDQIAEGKGAVHIAARATGTLPAMAWQADLVFERVGFLLPDLDQSVHDLNGRVGITPEQVTVRDLAGMLDTGRFMLEGRVGLTDLRPARGALAVTLQALPLQVPGTLDARISGDLALTGDTQRARLEGNIILLEGSYYKDLRLNLLSAVTQTRRAEPLPAIELPSPWLGAIDLDVAVTHRYPFLVDNNVARLEVIPDLRLSGTAARPVLDGRARVTEGEVYFRRRTFAVTRGVVDFINPHKIEPTLDIAAETRIRQYQILLTAAGTPDNLAITLQSNPPESDSNILSLILLGRTSDELAGGGGGATTGQMLASLIESAWGEDIKRGVGVDILEVETGSPAEGKNDDRIQVTVGRRLSPRMTIKYAVESGSGETIQRAISEYRLLEHVLASGFQDTAGVYGGELLFRFEFR
jgi:translocation and assembly module TamB